ncbi:uncharacterized protein LOC133173808 isoform X2 [Saccostrea echinata]|uniref:uncharacterized protein LOC133173808 isoform X2 n=1 Tax=Saccostrea echinata TaxID=191078 RepID=UPI002A81B0EC|nr:uncharacterized protein LOC133173808 isoform X2 [Saccostrea echinata]
MSDRRKSKRRSSLAASRIQLQYEKAKISSSGELYKIISPDKTDEERLAALHRTCLEYTLQKLEEENPNLEGLEDLKKTLLDQGLRKISELEENGSFKQACNNDRILTENPHNLEMDEIIEALISYNKKLEEETDQWESLLRDSNKAVSDMEAQKPDKLSPLTWREVDQAKAAQYLPDPLDVSLCNKLERTVEEVNKTVEKFGKTVSVVQNIQILCDKMLKEKSEKLKVDSFKDNHMFTPRTLIQRITGLQTPKA